MEKESQPESMATVAMKPEYAPSEYSSEPPPAYHKPKSASVQIAKIIAVTVVLTALVLGSFLLASAYVSATASCRQLEQELEILSEAADRLQGPLQPEALVQDEPPQSKRHTEPLSAEEPKKETKDIETNNIDDSDNSSETSEGSDSNSDSSSESEEQHPNFRLPLQLDLEQLAKALLEKNQETKMNCIVEKKRAEEVVDHQPKTIRLPFGVNLTTDPRHEKLSGERVVIVCESGTLQRSQPPPPSPPQEDDDQEEDTIMIQPVMIPIPQTHFQTHMPQQNAPPMMQNMPPMRQFMRFPMRPPMNSMETMRPPVPPMMQIQIEQQQQSPQSQPQSQGFPPNPILRHIVQQIIAQKIAEAQKAREEQMQREQQQQQRVQVQEVEENSIPHRFQFPQVMMGQRIPIPEEVLTQLNRLPNRDVIVAVSSESDSDESSQESRSSDESRVSAEEIRPIPQRINAIPQELRPMPQGMRPMPQELRPLPQEMRPMPQLVRSPPQEVRQVPQQIRIVPVEHRMVPQELHVVSQEMQAPQEVNDQQEAQPAQQQQVQMHVVPQEVRVQQELRVPQEMRFVQEQRSSAADMNGRQGYARTLPVNIPVAMMPHEQERDQEPQASASEETRPHYVQPRSVREVEA